MKTNALGLSIAAKLFLIVGFSFYQPAQAATLRGFEVVTQGSFLTQDQQRKLAATLASNPAALLGDIDFPVENKLKNKIKELELTLADKLQKNKKKKLAKQKEKIQNLLDQRIEFVHEYYIDADALNTILSKNPYLVRLFGSGQEPKKSAEAELYHTKQQFAQAFNSISEALASPITYERYLVLREQYKDIPFFKLLHNVRECIGCGISRLELPFVRAYFEKQVVDYVLSAHPDKKQQLVITDFASGNLFQIFVVVNKLVSLGYTNIRLNLVDIAFKGILERYQHLSAKSPSAKFLIKPGTFELSRANSDAIFDLAQSLSGSTPTVQETSDTALDVLWDLISDSEYNNTFAYFSQFFNGTGANIDLVIYGDAADYLSDAKLKPALKADLLLGVDYFTENNDVFEDLRKQGLKDTGMAFTIDHHFIGDDPHTAEFYFSSGTKQQPDMAHFEWDLKNQKLHPVKELPGTLDYYLSRAQLAELFTQQV